MRRRMSLTILGVSPAWHKVLPAEERRGLNGSRQSVLLISHACRTQDGSDALLRTFSFRNTWLGRPA